MRGDAGSQDDSVPPRKALGAPLSQPKMGPKSQTQASSPRPDTGRETDGYAAAAGG